MSREDLTKNADEQIRKSAVKKKNKSNPTVFGLNLYVDGGFDIIYMILVFALLTIGLVMMFSASYVFAKYDASSNGNPFYFIIRQGLFAVVGVIAMFIISKINPEIFKKIIPLVASVSILLLVVVLFYHTKVNDANSIKRWMNLGVATIQPSDVAKLGLIMTFAYSLEKRKKDLERKPLVPVVYVMALGGVCLLVYLEKHLSGTILMLLIGMSLLFLSGIDRRWFIFGFGVAIVLVGLFWIFKDKILDPYQVERITGFFDKDYTDTDTRWQTNQSLFALGSGGFFGLGLGNSRQKFLYLPEPQNDFIFAIVGEELGLVRCIIIILLFMALIARGFVIALRAKSTYERLLVLGISLQLGFQTVLNLLVVTDMMPNTGISLPFFSYGGTALLIQLIEMGLVLGVSRSGERRPRRNKKSEEAGVVNA